MTSPPAVLAHGFVGRADLPIPATMFGAAAALALVLSFLALAAGWTRPRLEAVPERPLVRVPRWADAALGTLGVAAFAVVVYAGLAGTDVTRDNLAPTAVYVAFWVGIPVLSVAAGDVFRVLSPWRAVGRAAGASIGRLAGPDAAEPLPYPERLGRWPAVAGLVGFTLVELCWGQGSDPQALAVCALAYFAVQLVGMGLFGVEPWSRNGDAFGVLFGLYASLSPLARRAADRTLVLRPPLVAASAVARPAGTVALLCVTIGSTAFDGAKEGPLFGSVAPRLQALLADLGLSKASALEASFAVGLGASIALVAAVYRIGTARTRHAGASPAFVHTLVPIAAAYVVAHYFSLLAYQGQSLRWLASDPLGDGSDLLGTAGGAIDYGVVSATGIWYVQVGALVLGHVAALVLAHDRALARSRSPAEATRSQLAMLVVMVAFTLLGLWLLSVAGA